MRRYESNHNDDYPPDTTRPSRPLYTFQVVINNAREVTKAIRIPGNPLASDYVGVNADGLDIKVNSTDMISAIQRAFEVGNDAWHVLAEENGPIPCA